MAKVLSMPDVAGLLTENLNEETRISREDSRRSTADSEGRGWGIRTRKRAQSGKEKYSEKKSKEDEKKAAPAIKRK
jgi:hypothetical protein